MDHMDLLLNTDSHPTLQFGQCCHFTIPVGNSGTSHMWNLALSDTGRSGPAALSDSVSIDSYLLPSSWLHVQRPFPWLHVQRPRYHLAQYLGANSLVFLHQTELHESRNLICFSPHCIPSTEHDIAMVIHIG